ncbi:hypothetical protein EDB19DRAFT_1708642 [Suillus lakei]|nr:hypothetical protein EDB19DRAFT_1708642 [Suillus lakei]
MSTSRSCSHSVKLFVMRGSCGRGSMRIALTRKNNVELQKSVNSMFVWYHNSAITIIYLSDVSPSSKSCTLSKNSWLLKSFFFIARIGPYTSTITLPTTRSLWRSCRSLEMLRV